MSQFRFYRWTWGSVYLTLRLLLRGLILERPRLRSDLFWLSLPVCHSQILIQWQDSSQEGAAVLLRYKMTDRKSQIYLVLRIRNILPPLFRHRSRRSVDLYLQRSVQGTSACTFSCFYGRIPVLVEDNVNFFAAGEWCGDSFKVFRCEFTKGTTPRWFQYLN